MERVPPPGAPPSDPSRLLHRRPGGSRAYRDARSAVCRSDMPADRATHAAAEGTATTEARPAAVTRLFPGPPPAALGRCQAGRRYQDVYVFSSAMAGYVMHATGARRIL